MVNSSLPSRAPLPISSATCGHTHLDSLQHVSETTTTTTTTRRLSQESPCFFVALFTMDTGWQPTSAVSGVSSDERARGGDTSSSRSLRLWPRLRTTAHSARRRPGGYEMLYIAKFRDNPPPRSLARGTATSAMTGGSRPDRLLAVSGLQERVQRHTADQIIDTFAPCRCSMLLCRWWGRWWKSSRSLTRWCLASSR